MTPPPAAVGVPTLPVAAISDACGGDGVIGQSVRWIAGGPSMAGTAYTVRTVEGDNLGLLIALERAQPGAVIVAECPGALYGMYGELAASMARARGVAGVVIDGGVRDLDELDEIGIPTFARSACVKKTAKRHIGDHQVPIVVGGTVVLPGSLVVGDRDGLVAVPADHRPKAIRRATEILAQEQAMASGIRSGRTITEMLGIDTPPIKQGSHS